MDIFLQQIINGLVLGSGITTDNCKPARWASASATTCAP